MWFVNKKTTGKNLLKEIGVDFLKRMKKPLTFDKQKSESNICGNSNCKPMYCLRVKIIVKYLVSQKVVYVEEFIMHFKD